MATYYVSGTGNDSSDGLSEGTAFRTLQRAANLVRAGDTVLVMDGTYENPGRTVMLIRDKQGTATEPITFRAYPGANPVIDSDGSYAVIVSGSSYITIEGLTLVGAKDSITLDYAESQRYVTGNPLTTNTGIAIAPTYDINGQPVLLSHHITIRNNTVTKFSGGGIVSNMADYVTIENNTVSENSWYTNNGSSAISILNSVDSDNNTTDYKIIIRGNTVYDNQSLIPWLPAGRITEGHGIILDTNRNNAARPEVPFDAYQGRFLVANNLVYNNGGFGINVFQSENADLVNNTLYQNSRNPDLNGEIITAGSNNIRAENNILYARDGRRANLITSSTNVVFDRNLAYNSSIAFQSASPPNAALGGGFAYVDSVAANAEAANVLAAGLQNIVGQDPLFVDPVNGNFMLQAGSPAIDTGSTVYGSTVGTDILGTTRRDGDGINGIQTDLGAYEYTGTPTLTPALFFVAATDSVNPEGNAGTTPFTFTINRTGNTTNSVSVDYAVTGSGSSFANGADFVGGALPSGTINFAANETSKTLTINVQGDTTPEPDQGFTVTLTNPSAGSAIATAAARGVVQNDDSATLEIAILNGWQLEGDYAPTPYRFTVFRSGDTSGTTSVNYTVFGSGANPADGDDFVGGVLPTGTITFLPNETSKELVIEVNGDLLNESDEGFVVSLSGATGGATITTGSAGATIRNNDNLPIVSITATDAEATETDLTPGRFTVTRTGNTDNPLTVEFTVEGTATNGSDYTSIRNRVTIPAGASSTTIAVTPIDDAIAEGNETVVITLLSGRIYKLGAINTSATVTLTDDDAPTGNVAPTVATPISDQVIAPSSAYTFVVPTNTFADPNSDPLSLTATLSDGSPLPSWLSFDLTTNTFSGTPTSSDLGILDIRLTAHDGQGGIVSDTFNLTVNTTPTLGTPIADQIIQLGNPLSLPLPLDTFIDPDGQPLSLTATLSDGNPLPGWLSFNPATNTLSGTPTTGNAGVLNINLIAADSLGGTISDNFALTVNTPPSVATPLSDLTISASSPFSFTVPANTFIDADGNPLSLIASSAGGTPLPSWLSFDPTTLTFSGIPTDADIGSSTINLTALDNNGGIVTDDFSLTVQQILPTMLNGTDLSETLVGTAPSNMIYGFGGQDLITGGSGNDSLYGGDGNDRLWGHQGNDILYGEAGNDQLWGDDGGDILFGGLGDDQLYGGAGNDWLYGDVGNDVLTGGTGADTFVIARGQGIKAIRDFEVGTDRIAMGGGLNLSNLLMQQRSSQTWLIDSSINQVVARLDGISSAALSGQTATTFFTI
ncbi:MAG TPA: putative Ig domain-containing protein [Leptolyngbyaceae cyanobacterium M33_DOE_097]|uniref:DUF1565 domain-containing protein n=1 Tax=Oscillatoriales cyanobacterium SpSt-418 TaxID=2282169 RepID=A0A7C3KBM2_9CYAN|nr:putative Ig domain-containing protein [Leptolyngbyaceae cyanobacterium M33_DOE_097]